MGGADGLLMTDAWLQTGLDALVLLVDAAAIVVLRKVRHLAGQVSAAQVGLRRGVVELQPVTGA